MAARFRTTAPLVFAVLTLVVVACSPGGGATPSAPASGTADTASPTLGAGAGPLVTPPFPLTLTDDAGREVVLSVEPERIVSLAPSNTEIVCALGACPRLVGVTDFDDYPEEVTDLPEVVIQAQVDVEKVAAAQPDLILAGGNEFTPTPVIEELIDLGYPVLTLYAESLEEVYADIELVGAALNAQLQATELTGEMRARADAVLTAVADAPRPRTFYEVSVFEGTIYTAGEGSFLASLIEMAGGERITGHPQSFVIDLEQLVAAAPQLILLGDASYDPSITAESGAARPGWGGMTAVVEGRVVPVAEDVLITRPGPRIVEGLEVLAAAIHPEVTP